jgi:hypothetical protein
MVCTDGMALNAHRTSFTLEVVIEPIGSSRSDIESESSVSVAAMSTWFGWVFIAAAVIALIAAVGSLSGP